MVLAPVPLLFVFEELLVAFVPVAGMISSQLEKSWLARLDSHRGS